ncbi:MAG TPA: right-handed parallel beta-helix repeat-containing protein [Verrucomicrobiae bacterium]|nr:right-handed parallel beta-helix repeat-containing protein [Verrucomicrobiae bacterium]
MLSAAELAVTEVPANSSSQQIQEALNKLPNEGGEVRLSAGTYNISQPIVLRRDNQVLRGSGTATVLQLADNADCPVVILGAPLLPNRIPSHLRLSGVFIDGNRFHQKSEMWKSAPDGALLNNNGIIAWGVKDAFIEDVTCCRCRSGGLVTAHGVRLLTVHDFKAFDNQYDGLACYQTENSQFTKLYLHDNLCAGISLDLDFNHNVLRDAQLTNNDLGVFMRDSHDNVFQALKIQHSRTHGVFMAQAGDQTARGWRFVPGTQCTGNTFNGLVITDCGGKAVLVNDGSCTNNTVISAKFKGNAHGDLAEAAPNLMTMLSLP